MSKAKIGSLSALAIAAVIIGAGFSASDAKTSPAKQAGDVDPIVDMQTTQGDIKIKVFKKEAPITADNFLDLVQRGFYNGLSFHRWEPGFVIQGGDPLGNGTGGFTDPKTHRERTIKLEINPELKHDKGAVAMARSSEPNSASSQFYITLAPAHNLDGGYAVFGKVVEGMDNVLKLRNAQNSPKHVDDKIIKATIEQ